MRDETVDLEAYLRQSVGILNLGGGRGYDRGVRTFHCPLCDDRSVRGWMNIAAWSAGCFNSGCVAAPRLAWGALDWVRRRENLATRGETWGLLRSRYPAPIGGAPWRPAERAPAAMFCRLPPRTRPLGVQGALVAPGHAFARRQWGLSRADCARWELVLAFEGRYRRRIIIPIRQHETVVGFQARSIVPGIEPKYLAARVGAESDPAAECGVPLDECLFNVDAIRPGAEVVLVEGAGDVMGWHRIARPGQPAAGLLGQALTPGRLALLAAARPRRVLVAMDDELEAQALAVMHCQDLRAWNIDAARATWAGGKDAGSGATLIPCGDPTLREVLEWRMRSAPVPGLDALFPAVLR